ncbi:MAG TPA: hypothetical protein V6C90_21890 [Coleofasciculaceae cyanobacterium]|jgi:hypothetical protein
MKVKRLKIDFFRGTSQGFEQPDANGRYEEFCSAIAYILQLYFIT